MKNYKDDIKTYLKVIHILREFISFKCESKIEIAEILEAK